MPQDSRDLPIPSCPSGHIVCRPCKARRVTDCPTCRQPMPANITNSLAAALIDQVEHNCKFSEEGCEVKLMLKDLVTHEKQCPDRSINCPYPGCAQLVKLKNFNVHAFEGDRRHGWILRETTTAIFPIIIAENFPSRGILAFGQLFHVHLTYHKPSKCFVFRISLAKSQYVASQYKATLVIQGDNNNLTFDGIKVTSVENVPSIDKCIEETENIPLCLPMNLAKKISLKQKEDDKGISEYLQVTVSFKKNVGGRYDSEEVRRK